MTWLLLALAAHMGNALVFVVDKSLLGKKDTPISNPLRYAVYSGMLAGAAIILLPFAWAPLTLFVVKWALLAGVFHLAALYFFFVALKRGEPSRVVPIVGSLVPIFTLLIAVSLLGEVLTIRHLGAAGLLIAGGGLLSLNLTPSLGRAKWGGLLPAGALFAAYFATVKHLYDHATPFLAVFVWSRVIEAGAAIIVFIAIHYLTRPPADLSLVRRGARFGGRSSPLRTPERGGVRLSVVFVLNKVLAAGAFLIQSYAISLGSVTLVNALQGTQYLFLLVLAAAVSVWWPKLFREELHRVAISQKIAGIILISLGIGLLV